MSAHVYRGPTSSLRERIRVSNGAYARLNPITLHNHLIGLNRAKRQLPKVYQRPDVAECFPRIMHDY